MLFLHDYHNYKKEALLLLPLFHRKKIGAEILSDITKDTW